jgi:uncharacterized protein
VDVKDGAPNPSRHAVDVPGGRLCLILHLPADPAPAPCVIACHGLGASKDSDKYLLLGTELPAAGFALARFDFRGCGESSGTEEDTNIATRIEDVESVMGVLAEHPRLSGAFGLLGSSLGGFVALHVAARVQAAVAEAGAGGGAGAPGVSRLRASSGSGFAPSRPPMSALHPGDARASADPRLHDFGINAVVTWNAPSNLHELANDEKHDGRGIGVAFFTELATHKYDTTPSGVGCHLIVHGDADDVVPLDHATVLHSRAAEPCDIVVIEGGDHRLTDSAHRREAVDVSLRWFRRVLAPTARPS